MKTRNMNRRTFVTSASVAGGALLGGAGVAAYSGSRPGRLRNLQSASPEAATAGTPQATPTVQRDTIPPEIAQAADTDWPVEGYDLAQTRSVQGSAISSDTIGNLSQAWTTPVDASATFGALTANPIILGDTLYLQDASSNVYAMDRMSGEVKWTKEYNEQVPSGGPNGIAIGYGAIVYPVGVGGVVAADADTGEDIWSVDITGPRGEGITMAPLIYNNRVIISTIPGGPEEFYQGGMRGVIKVLDFGSGEALWTFDTTTDNLWGNPSVNSGGGLWHPPAIDDEGNLYVGIGNAAPYPGTPEWPNASSRPGPNPWCNYLLKLDLETGDLLWALPVNPNDHYDLDNQLGPILASVDTDKGTTDMVFTSGKHGYVVAADPNTGKEIWRTPVGTHQNENVQHIPEGETITVWPGTFGGVETPMAYQDGVVYAAVFEFPSTYSATKLTGNALDFGSATGVVVALDATNGSVLWSVEEPSGTLAGATVVNDLVFTAALDGVIRAHSVEDGSVVWTAQATAGLNAPLAISGDYLYVPAGGPLMPSDDTENPDQEVKQQLMAFKLGG